MKEFKVFIHYVLLFILCIIGSATFIVFVTMIYAYLSWHIVPHGGTKLVTFPKLIGDVLDVYLICTCLFFIGLLTIKAQWRKPKIYFIWFSLVVPFIALYISARMLFSFQFTDEHFLPDNQVKNYSSQPDIIDDSNIIPR